MQTAATLSNLDLRVTVLEQVCQSAMDDHFAKVDALIDERVDARIAKVLADVVRRTQFSDAVIQDVRSKQQRLTITVNSLVEHDCHDELRKDVLDLQQMMQVLKRNRDRGALGGAPSRQDNVALVKAKAAAAPMNGSREAQLAGRVAQLEESVQVMSVMHYNLRDRVDQKPL
jgi:hypothetical protein